jgi:hypothetical protein
MSLIFDKVLELKEKFKSYYQHRKKLRALKNYSQVAPFMDQKKLVLIEGCLNEGFLTEAGTTFLGELLDNYKVNYLDWSYKTRWLKNTMREMGKGVNRRAPGPIQTTIFDYKMGKLPEVTLEIMPTEQPAQARRSA